MRRCLGAILTLALIFSFPSLILATTPPRDGGGLPSWYVDGKEKDRNFLQFQNAWINKVQRARENRERFLLDRGFFSPALMSTEQARSMMVTGTVRVPVICSKFLNTPSNPWAVSSLQQKLFDGPSGGAFPQTLTEYYAEISYGNITMTGDVYGWTQLANNDVFYEGPSGCNGLCGTDNLDQYVTETLGGNDGAVDFSQYDNDGPDGLPNSGDDDGFVDFIAFVHPEVGAECGGTPFNIWSHRWNLTGLLGAPYTTNDAAAGGGFIKLNDYVIQPAFNCDGVSLIDIGVFCHEFGHAFGLPDLYDTNGGSEGIGEWGLMGSGSWNTTDNPGHMTAWSKAELGWLNVIDVGTNVQTYSVSNVEQNNTVYRLKPEDQRWRRASTCAIAGSFSMRCGLTAAEGAARSWATGDGYADEWREKVSREFHYDGVGSVSFQYDYSFDSEPSYDYTYARIDVGGTVTTLATYDGTGSGTAIIDLTPILSVAGATDYTLSIEFESDEAWSDRDGLNNSTCGPFVFDNVSVTGGGEAYATDFETRENGWWPDLASPAEFFYLENRQPVASDVAVNGAGGISISHINEDVANTPSPNTGGSTNVRPRGVAMEQADGLGNLEAGANRGDAGDPYPGSTINTTFNNASTPNSKSYSGLANNVAVTNIALNPANGNPMSVDMKATWPLPTVTNVTPNVGDDNMIVSVELLGTGLIKGATVQLNDGINVVPATIASGGYDGRDHVLCAFDLNGAVPGVYDVILTNPGDGSAIVSGGFTINGTATGVADETPRQFALRQNYPNPFNPATVIPFDIKDRVQTTLSIYNVRGQLVRTLLNEELAADSYRINWDGRNNAGHAVTSGVYFYKLTAGSFADVRKLTLMK